MRRPLLARLKKVWTNKQCHTIKAEDIPPPLHPCGSEGRPWSGKSPTSPLAQGYLQLELSHKALQYWPQIPGSRYIVGMSCKITKNGLPDGEIQCETEIPTEESSNPRTAFWETYSQAQAVFFQNWLSSQFTFMPTRALVISLFPAYQWTWRGSSQFIMTELQSGEGEGAGQASPEQKRKLISFFQVLVLPY